jgi:hypothetical protein
VNAAEVVDAPAARLAAYVADRVDQAPTLSRAQSDRLTVLWSATVAPSTVDSADTARRAA